MHIAGLRQDYVAVPTATLLSAQLSCLLLNLWGALPTVTLMSFFSVGSPKLPSGVSKQKTLIQLVKSLHVWGLHVVLPLIFLWNPWEICLTCPPRNPFRFIL